MEKSDKAKMLEARAGGPLPKAEIKKIKEVKKEAPKSQKKAPPPKLGFKKRKENTLHSLKEVEHFLCNFDEALRITKLFFLLK